jgi:hypothetical protein
MHGLDSMPVKPSQHVRRKLRGFTRLCGWVLCGLLLGPGRPAQGADDSPEAAASAARTQGFVWVDERGGVNITTSLAALPEPYQGLYRARAAQGARRSALPPSPPAQPAARAQYQAREALQAEVARWRNELYLATLAFTDSYRELQALPAPNPVLRYTPTGRQAAQRRAELQLLADAALQRLLAARRFLLVDLPRRAAANHLPPAWLQ